MRKTFLLAGLVSLLLAAFSSCSSMRDCHGVKHTRLSNGVRI